MAIMNLPLSILTGLVALGIILVVACQKTTPIYLTICGAEFPGIGVCQRNGGHSGEHTYVHWPRP